VPVGSLNSFSIQINVIVKVRLQDTWGPFGLDIYEIYTMIQLTFNEKKIKSYRAFTMLWLIHEFLKNCEV
jgi:hypothetical protein